MIRKINFEFGSSVVPGSRAIAERERSLLGSHTYSVRAFCFGRRVCCPLSVCPVRSRKISEIGAKFRHFYRKSGSPSKIWRQ